MIFVFNVFEIDNNKKLGYVQDSLLNLNSNPKKSQKLETSSRFELVSKTEIFQKRLDMILDGEIEPGTLTASICEKVYNKHYKGYNFGELKVMPQPIKNIIF